jgi:hypothetical protein
LGQILRVSVLKSPTASEAIDDWPIDRNEFVPRFWVVASLDLQQQAGASVREFVVRLRHALSSWPAEHNGRAQFDIDLSKKIHFSEKAAKTPKKPPPCEIQELS